MSLPAVRHGSRCLRPGSSRTSSSSPPSPSSLRSSSSSFTIPWETKSSPRPRFRRAPGSRPKRAESSSCGDSDRCERRNLRFALRSTDTHFRLKEYVPLSFFYPLKPLLRLLSDVRVFHRAERPGYGLHPQGTSFFRGVVLNVFHEGQDAVGLAELMDVARHGQIHEAAPCPPCPVACGAEAWCKAVLHDGDRRLVETAAGRYFETF